MNVLDRREGWTCLFAFLRSFGLLLLFFYVYTFMI